MTPQCSDKKHHSCLPKLHLGSTPAGLLPPVAVAWEMNLSLGGGENIDLTAQLPSGSCAVYPSCKTYLKCTSFDLPHSASCLYSTVHLLSLALCPDTCRYAAHNVTERVLSNSLVWLFNVAYVYAFSALPSLRLVSPLKFVFNFTITINQEPHQAGAPWVLVARFFIALLFCQGANISMSVLLPLYSIGPTDYSALAK